jgi:hypothetical protein
MAILVFVAIMAVVLLLMKLMGLLNGAPAAEPLVSPSN